MGAAAQYAAILATSVGQVSVANTNRDGSGALSDVFVAGQNGSRIDDIEIVATGVTTAGAVRLYLHNGTTAFLWKEVMVTAKTPSTTTAVWSYTFQSLALILKAGWKLVASTNNAETFNLLVTRAGDF